MTELSPDAQAVLDHFLADVEIGLKHGLAAALRAAADRETLDPEDDRERGWNDALFTIRTIAAELDPQ